MPGSCMRNDSVFGRTGLAVTGIPSHRPRERPHVVARTTIHASETRNEIAACAEVRTPSRFRALPCQKFARARATRETGGVTPGARVAIGFAAAALPSALSVTVRRLQAGPRHPGWSWRVEVLTDTMRTRGRQAAHGGPARLRATTAAAPLLWPLSRRVRADAMRVGDLHAERLEARATAMRDRPTVLYFHGGGYIFGSPASHRDMMARLAVSCGGAVIGIDYRLAPEHPFPAAVEDALHAYRALLDAGADPRALFVAGDSAGGGLTLSMLLRAREAGLTLPRGAVLLSPWVDLACRNETLERNAPYDYLTPDMLRWFASLYLWDADPRDPFASPLYADLRGLPPMLVQVGGAETLVGEAHELATRAEEAGVDAALQVWAHMPHGFQGFASMLPQGRRALAAAGRFIHRHR